MNNIANSDKNDLLIFVISGIFFFSLLCGFIVYFVIFYKQRQAKHLQEKKLAEFLYRQELLLAMNEIKENTLNHVAAELHDNIGQMASVVKMNLLMLPNDLPQNNHLSSSIQLMGNILQEIKTLSKGLKSEFLDEKGWIESLKIDVKRIEKLGINVSLISETEHSRLPNDKEIFVYRLCQETLHNMLQHANATEVHIEISEDERNLEIQISDNGKGFDISEYLEKDITEKGNGLMGMKKRCQMAGGNYHIESVIGKGTQIKIQIALR